MKIILTKKVYLFKRAKQYILDSLAKSGGLPLPSRFGTSSTSTPSFNDYGSRVNSFQIFL